MSNKKIQIIENLINQSIEINNAYIKKHTELKLVYKAYLKLVKYCNKDEIEININNILNQYNIINQQKLSCLISQQKDWMKELHQINGNIDKIIKNYKLSLNYKENF